MTIETKLFGEIAVDESKLISFPQGIIGFPELKDFLLIHDGDGNGNIKWMQSVQEPAFAMPVVDPLTVIPEYNPDIEDELLKPLGEITEENMLVIVTITVPKEIEKMTVNLKAPIIINSESRKAAQLIIDSDRYQVKFPIYEILKAAKEKAAAEKAGE
ncbi:MAG: flagellar assembly protein FliW [Lachnospiraceae bacterium]|nr:flagellar assembly protein FliW [Lachnospiraceae bacterium]